MPVFRLSDSLAFPDPALAEPEGLLAVGGDLSPARLLLAYSLGIFPWFGEGEPLLWWSPDPRCVLLPGEFHCSRRLARTLRRGQFALSCDRAFGAVLRACAGTHRTRVGATWIDDRMIAAYERLWRLGYAHSAECWQGGELVGGVYGVALGRCFFGESMFHRARDASKAALAHLVARLREEGCELFDCQQETGHLLSLGARCIPRAEFLARLRQGGVVPSAAPPPGPLLRTPERPGPAG